MAYSPIARATLKKLIPSAHADAKTPEPVETRNPDSKPSRHEKTGLSAHLHGYELVIQTLDTANNCLQELITNIKQAIPRAEVRSDGRKRRKISPGISGGEMPPDCGPTGLGKLGIEEIDMLTQKFHKVMRGTIDVIVSIAWEALERGNEGAPE